MEDLPDVTIVAPTAPPQVTSRSRRLISIKNPYGLTAQEILVARMIIAGHSREAIAAHMDRSINIVHDKVKRLYAKIGTSHLPLATLRLSNRGYLKGIS